MSRLFNTMTEGFNGDVETMSKELPVYESYNEDSCGDVLAISEAATDMIGVYEAMHAYASLELADEKNPGSVTMESFKEAAGNVFEKIKKSLKDLWAKIRSFFDNVIIAFNAKTKKAKEFATKYEDKLKALKLSGFKSEMYPYTNVDKISATYTTVVETVTPEFKNLTNAEYGTRKEVILETVRGKLTGGGRLSESEFKAKALEFFRGASAKKEESVNISSIISVLKNSESGFVKKVKTDMDKSFADTIKGIEDLKKSFETQGKGNNVDNTNPHRKDDSDVASKYIELANNRSKLFSSAQGVATTYFNIWKAVYSEREAAFKSICVKAFSYKAK